MSDDTFCIPSPCSFDDPPFPPGCQFGWCFDRCIPITTQRLYDLGYLTWFYAPIIFDGVVEAAINDASSWGFGTLLFLIFPYVVVFIVLAITLIFSGAISAITGILIIVLAIVMAILSVVLIREHTSGAISSVETNITSILNNNFNQNRSEILRRVRIVVENPDALDCDKCLFTCSNVGPTGDDGPTGPTGPTGPASLTFANNFANGSNQEDIDTLTERYRALGVDYLATNTCRGCG